ncbi:hypothetical protein TKK_0011673 [Trichogramma kaykai]
MNEKSEHKITRAQRRKENRKLRVESGEVSSYRTKGGKKHLFDLGRVDRNLQQLIAQKKIFTCPSCGIDIVIVPPLFKCLSSDSHGYICRNCRQRSDRVISQENPGGICPFCRGPCTRDEDAEKLIDWDRLRIPCLWADDPESPCRHSFGHTEYQNHITQCALKRASASSRKLPQSEVNLSVEELLLQERGTTYLSVEEFLVHERGTTYLGVRELPHMEPFRRAPNFTW